MDRYDFLYTRGHVAHQNQVLTVIADYRYLAPTLLAHQETYQRLQAEAALIRLLPPARVPDRASSPRPVIHLRLGDLLMRLGTHLCDGGGWGRVLATIPRRSSC
jgi:hypothetical protein